MSGSKSLLIINCSLNNQERLAYYLGFNFFIPAFFPSYAFFLLLFWLTHKTLLVLMQECSVFLTVFLRWPA